MSSKTNNLEKNQLKSKNDRVLKSMAQIDSLLSNRSSLTNAERLSYCEGQRYLMKKYLKRLLNDLFD